MQLGSSGDRAASSVALRSGKLNLKSGTNRVLPYGLPSHLFRFELQLASAPRWRGHCVLLLIIARSFPRLQNQKQKGFANCRRLDFEFLRRLDQGCLNRAEIPAERANWTFYKRYAFVRADFSD